MTQFAQPRFLQLLNNKFLIAFLLGALCVVGYAPFYFYPASIVALAGYFYYLQKSSSARQAAWLGFAFGLGLLCTGVSWIYVSLHDFGGMPFWMAAFATFTFCAFLALFTAASGWLTVSSKKVLIAAPLFWVLFEWIRSWIFTGFPWLNVGYSQIPYGPLAGVAPVLGIYGVSLLVALTACLLVLIATPALGRPHHTKRYAHPQEGVPDRLGAIQHAPSSVVKVMDVKPTRKLALIAFIILWVGTSLLKKIEWTQPVGAPISVALIQGNIAQDMKWQPEVAQRTLDQYLALTLQSKARLIVLPETALPLLINEVPTEYLQKLKAHAQKNQGDILVGAVEAGNNQYYNSMLSFGAAPTQSYRKSHLVPFGEFIPLKSVFGWIYRDWLNMPLTDLSRGSIKQKPMQIAGQQVALNICYEDVFGEEIIRQLPQATLLVNASNDAWYGKSLAEHQHLQMSQTRALETGRMVLRATNTGSTAIIDTHGQVLTQLPHFTTETLTSTAQGYAGSTPYVRWGNWPVIIFLFISLTFILITLLWMPKNK